MELHSMLRRNIAHEHNNSLFCWMLIVCDVREGADVGRYQRCTANVAPLALSAAAAFPADRLQHDDGLTTRGINARARLSFCSAFALLLVVWETPQR
jgi:hypothetical protein